MTTIYIRCHQGRTPEVLEYVRRQVPGGQNAHIISHPEWDIQVTIEGKKTRKKARKMLTQHAGVRSIK